jgi:hypothetical protein
MTGRGVSDGDMPIFPWSARGGVPPVGDPAFDALLTGNLWPDDAAEALRPVAETITALKAAPTASELAAEGRTLAVYRAAVGRSAEPVRTRRRRRRLTSLLSARLAAAAAAGAVAVGGATAAAYAGALPAPVPKFAPATIGAPAAHHAAAATPVGPRASGKAGYGLCTAYAHLKADGTARQKAVAFRNLATAAGGAAKVTAYCAAVAHPGADASGESAGHSTGRPAGHPAGKPTDHRVGRPADHPTGKPADHPAGKPTSTP